MKYNNKFEKDIKSSFETYTSDLNHDEIWDNIEPHLKKKKKRRFFFIWFLLGGIGISLFLSNLFTPVSISPSTNDTVSNDLSPSIIEMDQSNNKKEIDIKKEAVVSNNNVPDLPKVINPKNDALLTSPLVEVPQNHSSFKSALNIEEKTISDNQLTAVPLIKTKLNLLNIPINQAEPSLELSLDKKKKAKKKLTKPLKNHWQLYTNFSTGYILPIKILSSKNGFNENYNYKQDRKKSEKQLEAFEINWNFQLQNRRGFIFFSGLEYQRINERFQLKSISEDTEQVWSTISVTENALGQIINSESGFKTRTTTITRTNRTYNSHTFINFPIGIGRAWRTKKHSYKIIGGFNFNLFHEFKGTFLLPNLSIVDLRNGKDAGAYDQIFKKKTGLGFWIATQYYRPINERTQWFLASKVQIPINAITNDDYSLAQRYINLNIDIGVSYLMNPKKYKATNKD